jgi:hypothetical protein
MMSEAEVRALYDQIDAELMKEEKFNRIIALGNQLRTLRWVLNGVAPKTE